MGYPKTHPNYRVSEARRGENRPDWKGDEAGYAAKHDWVKVRLGKPKNCAHCGTTEAKRFDWANISGKYQRDLKDWIRLCRKCHQKFDGRSEKVTKWMKARWAKVTHCKRGHEFTKGNTYVPLAGGRECRICRAASRKRYEIKNKK